MNAKTQKTAQLKHTIKLLIVLFTCHWLFACGAGSSEVTDNPDNSSDNVVVSNNAPVANAGAVQTVSTGSTVTLDGSASLDADGDPLTYAWSMSSKPDGSSALLSNELTSAASFIADVDGDYVITLVVNDGQASSPADSVTITSASLQHASLTYVIVDTNQSACFGANNGTASIDCANTGEDASYYGEQASYTLSTSGESVTDNVTGLIWTQTPDIDSSGTINASDKLLPDAAIAYCENLILDGRSDWRLPSIKELYSLMQFSGRDPSGYTGSDSSALVPFIDDSIFAVGFGDISSGERIIDGQYATTSMYTSTTMNGNNTMFGVNFIDGRIKGYPSHSDFYVYCVAGNGRYGENDFVDNGDNTVSDLATGLMWQQQDYHSNNWQDAINYCESLSLASYSDWRLPNVKELHSLVDYARSPAVTHSAAIDPIFFATSFVNEAGSVDWGSYWSSTTHVSYTEVAMSAAYISFGESLGYFSGIVQDVHGAGAQRSDNKISPSNVAGASAINLGQGTFYYHGPQGDILRADNFVRCVRTNS